MCKYTNTTYSECNHTKTIPKYCNNKEHCYNPEDGKSAYKKLTTTEGQSYKIPYYDYCRKPGCQAIKKRKLEKEEKMAKEKEDNKKAEANRAEVKKWETDTRSKPAKTDEAGKNVVDKTVDKSKRK